MADVSRRRHLTVWERIDVFLGLGLAVCVLGYQAATGALGENDWTLPIITLLCCSAIAGRRRRPFTASVATTTGLVLVWVFGQEHAVTGATNLLIAVPPLVAYTLGTNAGLGTGLAGAALLAVGLQLGGPFNPLYEMITFGPLLAGRVVRSRRLVTEQIELRNEELEAERERFALESVRYERALMARELHDIVAHSLSVVILQAAAAQRSSTSSAAALEAIVAAARDAEAEIRLLNRGLDVARSPGLDRIDELVRRATANGVPVRYRSTTRFDELGAPRAEVAYRVVQEGLTNAIKHAPGATIDIALRERNHHLEIEVTNGTPEAEPSGLEHEGAGRGLSGMRQRVRGCGGTLTAGPTHAGRWRVVARLPNDRSRIEAAPHPAGKVTTETAVALSTAACPPSRLR
jgi:signal transduction histidine kinase